jgi:hypothetical protein
MVSKEIIKSQTATEGNTEQPTGQIENIKGKLKL